MTRTNRYDDCGNGTKRTITRSSGVNYGAQLVPHWSSFIGTHAARDRQSHVSAPKLGCAHVTLSNFMLRVWKTLFLMRTKELKNASLLIKHFKVTKNVE